MTYAIVAAIVLIMDQAMKYWTTRNIPLNPANSNCLELFKGFLHITDVHNTGAAFNILQNGRWLLVGVTVLFTVAVIVLIAREVIHTRFGKWTAILVMAGALGNGIDRALFGYVVDMFEFEFLPFPVFNIADMFITICGILFCIHVIFHRETEEELAAKQNEESAEKENKYVPDFDELAPVARKLKKPESPYDRVPKRSEHARQNYVPTDAEDPFAEWEIGSGDEPAAPKKRYEEPEDEDSEEEEQPDLFSFEPEPVHKKSPKTVPVKSGPVKSVAEKPEKPTAARLYTKPTSKPAAPESAKTDDGSQSFSLEDILAEFGDDQK